MADNKQLIKANSDLYELYLATNTKEGEAQIEAQFIKLNEAILFNKLSLINIHNNPILETEDALQIIKLAYIEELKKLKGSGYTTYRHDIFKMVENDVKKYVADNYNSGGFKMTYSTKKRHINAGIPLRHIEPIRVCNDESEQESDSDLIVVPTDGISTEEIVLKQYISDTIKKGIHDALSELSDDDRNIILMRSLHEDKRDDMKWAEIGKTCGMSAVYARRRYFKALEKIKQVCVELELDAYL